MNPQGKASPAVLVLALLATVWLAAAAQNKPPEDANNIFTAGANAFIFLSETTSVMFNPGGVGVLYHYGQPYSFNAPSVPQLQNPNQDPITVAIDVPVFAMYPEPWLGEANGNLTGMIFKITLPKTTPAAPPLVNGRQEVPIPRIASGTYQHTLAFGAGASLQSGDQSLVAAAAPNRVKFWRRSGRDIFVRLTFRNNIKGSPRVWRRDEPRPQSFSWHIVRAGPVATACMPGMGADATEANGAGKCFPCKPGTAGGLVQTRKPCTPCVGNTVAGYSGDACVPCPATAVASPDNSFCVCPAGSQLNALLDTCIPQTAGKFHIQLVRLGTDKRVDLMMQQAAYQWEGVMNVDLPNHKLADFGLKEWFKGTGLAMEINDLLIVYSVYQFTGSAKDFLAMASYDLQRLPADGQFQGLPITGHIDINSDPIQFFSRPPAGQYRTLLHEMGHVLGIGSLLMQKGCIPSTCKPGSGATVLYQCNSANKAYNTICGLQGINLRIETTRPSPASSCAHWEEQSLRGELMTPDSRDPPPPITELLSSVSIGALEDLYGAGNVDYTVAEPWTCGLAIPAPVAAAGADSGKPLPPPLDEGTFEILEDFGPFRPGPRP